MKTQLKQENARIERAMQAKSANGKTAGKPKPNSVKTTNVQSKQNSPAPNRSANRSTVAHGQRTAKPTPPKPAHKANAKNSKAQAAEKLQVENAVAAALDIAAEILPEMSADKQPKGRAPKEAAPSPVRFQAVLRAGTLKAALKSVDRARGKNSALPVLSHIHIEALDKDCLRFTATDLNFTLWHLAAAKVLQHGAVCVPELLGDLLAKVNDDVFVTLTTDKLFNLTIEAGRLNLSLKGLNPQEFPPASTFNGKTVYIGADMTYETVSEIAKRVAPFVSDDAARPVLQGVYVSGIFPQASGQNATLTFVGADGFRMCALERDVTIHFDQDQQPLDTIGLIVPGRVFGETLKIATDNAKPIQFLFHLRLDKKGVLEHGMVQVETNAGGLRMNLIDGNFPDFTQIIPNPMPQLPYLPLAIEPTVSALQRAALVSKIHGARLTVKADHILITAQDAETGKLAETIHADFDAAWQPDADFEIAFNALFLGDALRAAAYKDGTQPIPLRVSTSAAPAYISAPRYRHVIMPMHVGDGTASAAANATPATEPTPTETETVTADNTPTQRVESEPEVAASVETSPSPAPKQKKAIKQTAVKTKKK